MQLHQWAGFVEDLRAARLLAQVPGRAIGDKSTVSRVEHNRQPPTEALVLAYEHALGRQDLLPRFRALITAPATEPYSPPERDDFQALARLDASRVALRLGSPVLIRDARTQRALSPPLGGLRLRNAVPQVDGRTPRVSVRAEGAEVLSQRWETSSYLMIDVGFDPAPQDDQPFDFTVLYEFDVMAPYFTELPTAPSALFTIQARFPSAAFEVADCRGLPQVLGSDEGRRFLAGEADRLGRLVLNRRHELQVVYRDLRPSFIYGIFWRPRSD